MDNQAAIQVRLYSLLDCVTSVLGECVSLDLPASEHASGWVCALLAFVYVCVRLARVRLLSQRKADQDRAAQLQPLAPKTMNVSSF